MIWDKLHIVEIKAKVDEFGRGQVWVDGEEWTNRLSGISFFASVDGLTEVTLTIPAARVDLEAKGSLKKEVDTGSPNVYDEATSKQRVTEDTERGKQHDTAASQRDRKGQGNGK